MPEDTATADAVVIERTIDAPPEQVWTMWTDPDRFRQWYGPDGATIPTARFDLQVGGERVVAMTFQTPGGERTMWFQGEHVEVEAPRLLVYTEAIADEDGALQSPITTVRVDLKPVESDRTHLRLTHLGVPPDSPGADGWHMALSKLAAKLETA